MINNISNTTISGQLEDIEQVYHGIEMTELQGYCLIFGVFLTLIVLIIAIKDLIKNIQNRECFGCKRLARLEKDVKELKEKVSIAGFFDKTSLINLTDKIEKLSKEVRKNGN